MTDSQTADGRRQTATFFPFNQAFFHCCHVCDFFHFLQVHLPRWLVSCCSFAPMRQAAQRGRPREGPFEVLSKPYIHTSYVTKVFQNCAPVRGSLVGRREQC